MADMIEFTNHTDRTIRQGELIYSNGDWRGVL